MNATIPRIVRGQVYQVAGGTRWCIVSVTPDIEPDEFLVVQDGSGGPTKVVSVTEFLAGRPELVH